MITLRILFTIAIISFSTNLFSQDGRILFSLQQLPDLSWGVFVKPDDTTFPSERTSTGTGQVTIVAPLDFEYDNLINFYGEWVENARMVAPMEAINNAYFSFGFVSDSPKIKLAQHQEALLFTFTTEESFKGMFYLFENGNDPFEAPNSIGCNPGNDFGMLDLATGKRVLTYRYGGNYVVENKGAMAVMLSDDDGNEDE